MENPPCASPQGRATVAAKANTPKRLKFNDATDEQPNSFDSVKVFSATMHRDREQLGDTITRWMDDHPGIVIVDKVVSQSSDQAFHCVTITLFYRKA